MFIPSFHFDDPKDKMTPAWCMKAVQYLWYNNDNRSLLDGKNVDEIQAFASGVYDLNPFIRMFKSAQKKMNTAAQNPQNGPLNPETLMPIGVKIECVPMIPTKLNSAIATVQKVPIEPEVTAQDGLAMKKKQDDLTFLKNKPEIEADLQGIADQMQIGKVDLGATKNSFKKYSEAPYGLDLSDPAQEALFSDLIYSLAVETSFEKVLAQLYVLLKGKQVRYLETRDQYLYGVSADRNYRSSMTSLPTLEYIFPGRVRGPVSKLLDFSDQEVRIIDYETTPLGMFNLFSEEIKSEDDLLNIFNGMKGYCDCNGGGPIDKNNWGTYKVMLRYFEVKSVDWIGKVTHKKNRSTATYFTTDPNELKEKGGKKIWAQNTYCFYWLTNTKQIFGISKLDYSYRTKGQESFQSFSSNIYKSQEKSAVELCIGENKKAQIAEIKLQHALVKAMPSGKFVDLRFIRNALSGLKDAQNKYTIDDLIHSAFEQNIVIGDTEGFDGTANQLKPVIPLPGGLSLTEIAGYLQTMVNAANNISAYTGINEQLTGQSANPEGLVGLQKLLINSSINAIYYVTDAMRTQDEAKFTIWCSLVEQCVKEGGKVKQSIIDMIGIDDTDVIEGLNEAPLHKLTCKVTAEQRELERAEYKQKLNELEQKGIITTADIYILGGIDNPKERYAALAALEMRFKKEQDKIRQQEFAQAQQLGQQKVQGAMAVQQQKNESDISKIYAQGDVDLKLMQAAQQLGFNQQQIEFVTKSRLQRERSQQQTAKNVITEKARTDSKLQTQGV